MTLIQETDQTEFATWRQKRLAELTVPDGYLSLVGLCWLQPGENRFGAASENPCQFPGDLPDYIGSYTVAENGEISVTIADDIKVTHNGEPVKSMPIAIDRDPDGPTILELDSFSWFVIKRGEVLAIRIRNSESDALKAFSEIDTYPYDSAWQHKGRFIAHAEPQPVSMQTILGTENQMISPGRIEIEIKGESYILTALLGKRENTLFLVIADETTGNSTYGGGRFLYTDNIAEDGSVLLDFNKAINPPCVFTPYATCPLPPEENRFNFRIEAGEKNYGHH